MSEQPPHVKNLPVLLVQLVVANIVVAGTVTALLYWLFTGLMDAYFNSLTAEFGISPTKLNSMFAMDVEQSLWWVIALALALGIALALILTRTLIRPITQMVRATEKIAQGELSARSPTPMGELGKLGWHLNEMASALERQEEERQQLLRDLSHELRTPLTNVKGYIEGLEDGVFQVGPEVFEVLNGEVRRLNALIDDLSELSISERLSGALVLEPVNLREELASVIAAHRAGMVETGFEVRIEESGIPGALMSDKRRLRQIFSNALSNMVRYAKPNHTTPNTGREGLISVDWRARKEVNICFENWAEPIPQEQVKRLFDRFYRVDQSRSGTAQSGRSQNVGLGLAIVKRLVSALGGTVRVNQTGGRFQLCIKLGRAGQSGD
ncbi:MAG TPA: HAMP domain-containing protein [Devosia sp.]|nr:HAMP domain-containing protein [Devosia sp.]